MGFGCCSKLQVFSDLPLVVLQSFLPSTLGLTGCMHVSQQPLTQPKELTS